MTAPTPTIRLEFCINTLRAMNILENLLHNRLAGGADITVDDAPYPVVFMAKKLSRMPKEKADEMTIAAFGPLILAGYTEKEIQWHVENYREAVRPPKCDSMEPV